MFRCNECHNSTFVRLNTEDTIDAIGDLIFHGEEGFSVGSIELKFKDLNFDVSVETELICNSCGKILPLRESYVRCRECGRINSPDESFAVVNNLRFSTCTACKKYYENEEFISFSEIFKNPPENKPVSNKLPNPFGTPEVANRRIYPHMVTDSSATRYRDVTFSSLAELTEDELSLRERREEEIADIIQGYLDEYGEEPSDSEIDEELENRGW